MELEDGAWLWEVGAGIEFYISSRLAFSLLEIMGQGNINVIAIS
jgi:hypothetical protein